LTPVRAVGRGLRRLVLPVTGFWELVRRLDELRAQLAAVQPRLDGIEARLAAVQPRLDDADARFAAEAEWARLRHDLAVQRHEASLGRFDDLTRRLAAVAAEQARPPVPAAVDEARLAARNGPLAALVAAEIDRLDGYLVHHAATLRGGVDAMRTELGAAARGVDAMRTELGAAAHGVDAMRTELGAASRGVEALRAERPAALAYAAPGLDALVMAGDFDLVVPAAEEGLLVYILRHGLGGMEPGVRALVRRRVKAGAVAVDAGANIGVHSLALAAAVGPEGRVVCFEPLQHLASALERSLRLNGFADRARVERAALADRPGEATFHRAAHGPMSSLYPLPAGAGESDVRVTVTTLDADLPAGSRVDFVKMDVEGAEPRLWRGMRRVVADNPGLEVVLEWSASHFRRSGEDPHAFMASIRDAGFNAFLVEDGEAPGRLAPVGDPAALEAANLLLTRQAEPDGVPGEA
jgi:FkbM family methyltransferase